MNAFFSSLVIITKKCKCSSGSSSGILRANALLREIEDMVNADVEKDGLREAVKGANVHAADEPTELEAHV